MTAVGEIDPEIGAAVPISIRARDAWVAAPTPGATGAGVLPARQETLARSVAVGDSARNGSGEGHSAERMRRE